MDYPALRVPNIVRPGELRGKEDSSRSLRSAQTRTGSGIYDKRIPVTSNHLGMPSRLFSHPPLDLNLKTNEIHIWCTSLDQSEVRLQTFAKTLSSEELSRAERFYFEEDRKYFIARRGILRTILGFYLTVAPNQLEFYYGPKGKPTLKNVLAKKRIRFNLSHSNGVALYAFSRHGEVGVDIEHIRDIPEIDRIAELILSAKETAVFRSSPPEKKREAFFNCWTRKEALVKATGDGFYRPLDSFDVTLATDEFPGQVTIEGDPRGASQWSVRDLKPADGFAAAFAVLGQSWRLQCWQWTAQVLM